MAVVINQENVTVKQVMVVVCAQKIMMSADTNNLVSIKLHALMLYQIVITVHVFQVILVTTVRLILMNVIQILAKMEHVAM